MNVKDLVVRGFDLKYRYIVNLVLKDFDLFEKLYVFFVVLFLISLFVKLSI